MGRGRDRERNEIWTGSGISRGPYARKITGNAAALGLALFQRFATD